MKTSLVLSVLLIGCVAFSADPVTKSKNVNVAKQREQKITLEGVGVSNFKVISDQKQIIILYKNDLPAYINISDIPFTVFETIECYPTDTFRAEVLDARFHLPNRINDSLQFASDCVRKSNVKRASDRNEHGFITLQPVLKKDMDRVYEK